MTNHIPPEKLLPQDMVHIFDHGPKDDPFAEPKLLPMHAVDAKHAMAVEPERYALEPRRAAPKLELVPEPEPDCGPETASDIVDFGTGEEV